MCGSLRIQFHISLSGQMLTSVPTAGRQLDLNTRKIFEKGATSKALKLYMAPLPRLICPGGLG